MMGCKNADIEVKFWIIKYQMWLAKMFRYRWLASICMFYLPIMIVGFLLGQIYHHKIFNWGIGIALTWVGLAPLFIEEGLYQGNRLFVSNRHLFQSQDEYARFRSEEIIKWQTTHQLISVLWGLVTGSIVLLCYYKSANLYIKLWAFISCFILFYVSSFGFFAICAIISTIKRMLANDLIFNPLHPDNFGGFSDIARFSVRIAFMFSSGTLTLLLAYEILKRIDTGSNIFLIAIYTFAFIYLILIFWSFVTPAKQIRRYVESKKIVF